MNEIPDIAECEVKVSYNNGEVEAEGKVLTIKPSTVSLSFMRYTLAKESREKSFSWPQRNKATEYNVTGAPQIDGYTYKATILRAGYIYIYFENKPDLFKEFQVDITGALTNIVSDLTEDERLPHENKSSKYYCISNKDVVWTAYSEFQWSAAYIDKIRQNQELREKRMQKFDATQWSGINSVPDAFTVDNIDGYFPLSDEDEVPCQMEDGRWTPGNIKDSMDAGKIQWWKTYYDQVELIEDVPDERDEVFFCLHDPLGCADELAEELKNSWDDMDATIMAIHSGVPVQSIKDKVIRNGGSIDDLITDKKKAVQIETLVKTATMLYKTSFSNKENIDKYGEGLDKERIEALLALAERREIRDEIKKYRILLTKFLQSKYYRLYCFFAENEGDLSIQEAQQRYYHFCGSVANPPHTLDAFLNLQEENERYGDSAAFKGKLKELIRIDELDTPSVIDITDELSGISKNSRFGIWAFMSIIDGIGDISLMDSESFEQIANNLNAIKAYVGGLKISKVFEIKKVKLSQTPDLLLFADHINPLHAPFAPVQYADKFENLRLLNADIEVQQLTFSEKFLNAIKKNNAFFDVLNSLKAKMPWDALMRKMAVLNLVICTKEAYSATKNDSNKGASYVAVIAGVVGVIEGVVKKRGEKALLLAETRKAQRVAEGMIRRAKILGGVGTILCGISDLIASYGEFNEKDKDAGWLLIGSGVSAVLLGVSTLMTAKAIASIAIIANPITAGVALVGIIGFTIWAIMAQDDPLERLIVNCLFDKKMVSGWEKFWGYEISEVIHKINSAQTISARNQLYYDNRTHLAKEGFEEWGDYIKLYTDTTAILNGTFVRAKKEDLIPGRMSTNRIIPAYNFYSIIKAEIICGQYYPGLSIFDLHVELYPYGNFDHEADGGVDVVGVLPTTNSSSPFSYKLSISIDKKYAPEKYEGYHYARAFVLLYYRIDIFGDQRSWNPIKDYKTEEPRYVASQIPLCLHTTHIEDRNEAYRFLGKTKSGTLKQIRDLNYWSDDYALNI